MFHGNPNLPSLHLEHLATVDLYSARIDDGYRAILERRGANYILLLADKHDDAYRWAERGGGASQSVELPVEAYIAIGSEPLGAGELQPDEKPPTSAAPADTDAGLGDLRIGSIHTWNELRVRFTWDQDKHGYYLPERNGRVVCACLRADLNPSAPWEILVGKEPPHIRKAELFVREPSPIPVFIKQAENQWEYWGRFRLERCETDPDKIRPVLPTNRLENTSMVLYLAEVG